MSALVDLVVAGPILWLASRVAAASWEAPLVVSLPPFRFPSFRRMPFESPLMRLLDRTADHETGTAPVRDRGARLTAA